MSRNVAIYGFLLVAALVASYLSWTSDPETTTASSVTIDQFSADDIDEITWETDSKRLVLDVRGSGSDREVWVTSVRRDGDDTETGDADSDDDPSRRGAPDTGVSASGDAGTDGSTGTGDAGDGADAGPPRRADGHRASEKLREQPDRPKERQYQASGAVETLFEKLDPLRARRAIEVSGERRKRAFGFDDPKGTLTLAFRDGTTRSFTVGGPSFGQEYFYVRDDRRDRYYVIGRGLLGPLRHSKTRLQRRRVVVADRSDLQQVVVQASAGTAKLVHHNRSDPSAEFWSVGDESTESRPAASWVRQLLRLQISEFVTDGRPSGLENAASVRIEEADGTTTRMKLFRKSDGDSTIFFAEADGLLELAKLQSSSAQTLVDDIPTLFGNAPDGESQKNDAPRGGPAKRRPSKGKRPTLPRKKGSGASPGSRPAEGRGGGRPSGR